jgi:acetyltransferase
MKDGMAVVIRPIRPGDEELLLKFHETLSDRSVRLRYFYTFSLSSRTAPERLTQICSSDYDRHMVLVAVHEDASSGTEEILGIGRLSKLEGGSEAEAALLVADRFQQGGLGSELLRRLIEIARDQKLDRIVAEMLGENLAMEALLRRFGFRFVPPDDPSLVRAVLEL